MTASWESGHCPDCEGCASRYGCKVVSGEIRKAAREVASVLSRLDAALAPEDNPADLHPLLDRAGTHRNAIDEAGAALRELATEIETFPIHDPTEHDLCREHRLEEIAP